ncbi:MAG: peptidoglycan editing factor PgeF [Anaerolineae bacterium]
MSERATTVPITSLHDIPVFQFSSLAGHAGLVYAISTRRGGVSPAPWNSLNLSHTRGDDTDRVNENHRRLCAALNIPADALTNAYQVHGAQVGLIGTAQRGQRQMDTDALITATPDTPLLLRFADCTPILLYDPVHHALGLAHAGWRGTVAGISTATVRAMQTAFGSRPADLLAGIGPAIGPCCYEVGDEVVEAVQQAFSNPAALLPPGRRTRRHFDLWAANTQQLREAGVRQIESAELCTACHHDWFFSHRAAAGRCGHFGAIAMLAAR